MNKILPQPAEGNTNPPLNLALIYAAHGWRVFPVNSEDKKPLDPETNRYMARWPDRATVEPSQIAAWWEHRPDLGIGLATGRATGIVVLDFDVTKGKAGGADKAKLEAKYGPLPPTLMQSTPSGGWQEFYRYPEAAEDVPNAQGFGYLVAGHTGAKLCGVDVRGDGGQVNVPPTAREAGAYRWHGDDPFSTPIAELPPAWNEALSDKSLPERPASFFRIPTTSRGATAREARQV